jgi:ABC-2 type transport system ATP-binding protein
MKVIEVSHLATSYAGRPAVADVSFEVQRGETFGVLGPNGAGKTTTVECTAGLRTPDAGLIQPGPRSTRDASRPGLPRRSRDTCEQLAW